MIGDVIICGFTGTRHGLAGLQADMLRWVLTNKALAADDEPEFHHGDCVGADEQAATLARELGFRIVGHPPTDLRLRCHFPSDLELDPLPYLDRDRKIVEATGSLIACPGGPEVVRSGTWATVRHARRIGRPRLIIRPDGSTHYDTEPRP